jgi:drug/metabolite transporter (DMT)-like permease
MPLDLRIPIGLLFGLVGVLLAGYGAVTGPEVYQQSLGINVNAWWGLVMLVFGLAMLALAWRAARRADSGDAAKGKA